VQHLFDQIDVVALILTADVIDLARFALVKDQINPSNMILTYSQSRTCIPSPYMWQRLAINGIGDKQRHGFSELVRPKRVASPRYERVQSVGDMAGTDHQFTAGLTRGVRAVRLQDRPL
jgi:hypothetical protein